MRLIPCIRWVECEAHPVHQVGGVCIRWVECEGLNKIHVISSAESLVARVLSRWLLGCCICVS